MWAGEGGEDEKGHGIFLICNAGVLEQETHRVPGVKNMQKPTPTATIQELQKSRAKEPPGRRQQPPQQ